MFSENDSRFSMFMFDMETAHETNGICHGLWLVDPDTFSVDPESIQTYLESNKRYNFQFPKPLIDHRTGKVIHGIQGILFAVHIVEYDRVSGKSQTKYVAKLTGCEVTYIQYENHGGYWRPGKNETISTERRNQMILPQLPKSVIISEVIE